MLWFFRLSTYYMYSFDSERPQSLVPQGHFLRGVSEPFSIAIPIAFYWLITVDWYFKIIYLAWSVRKKAIEFYLAAFGFPLGLGFTALAVLRGAFLVGFLVFSICATFLANASTLEDSSSM